MPQMRKQQAHGGNAAYKYFLPTMAAMPHTSIFLPTMAAMPHTSIFLPTMAAMPLTCTALFGGNAARQGRCENHNSTVKTVNAVNASAAAAPKKVQRCIQCHVHVLHQQACARNVFYLTKQSFQNTRAYCQNALDLCTGVKLHFVLPP